MSDLFKWSSGQPIPGSGNGLDADLLDGLHAATSGASAHVLATDATGAIQSTGPAAQNANGIMISNESSGTVGAMGHRGPNTSTMGTLAFYVAKSDGGSSLTPMTILGSGNVGIGTTAPQHTLQVYGTLKVGGAANQQTGVIALGDDTSTDCNNGLYRGGFGTLGGDNYLNVGGYEGVNITVGHAIFGSQTVCLSAGVGGLITIQSLVGVGDRAVKAHGDGTLFT